MYTQTFAFAKLRSKNFYLQSSDAVLDPPVKINGIPEEEAQPSSNGNTAPSPADTPSDLRRESLSERRQSSKDSSIQSNPPASPKDSSQSTSLNLVLRLRWVKNMWLLDHVISIAAALFFEAVTLLFFLTLQQLNDHQKSLIPIYVFSRFLAMLGFHVFGESVSQFFFISKLIISTLNDVCV